MSDQGGGIGCEMNEWMGRGGQSMRGCVHKWREWREVGWLGGGTAKVKEKRDKTRSERAIRVLPPLSVCAYSTLVCLCLTVVLRAFPHGAVESLPVCQLVCQWSD